MLITYRWYHASPIIDVVVSNHLSGPGIGGEKGASERRRHEFATEGTSELC